MVGVTKELLNLYFVPSKAGYYGYICLNRQVVSMGSLAFLGYLEQLLALYIQSLANRLILLYIYNLRRILSYVEVQFTLLENI